MKNWKKYSQYTGLYQPLKNKKKSGSQAETFLGMAVITF
jgi:hypothetical protein